jgi:two-component system response regulator NreC
MAVIRLMLVDDHAMIRTALKSLLDDQSEFMVVAEAGNGEEAIVLALKTRPDLILMDISMPEMDGIEATRRLKELWPECLILTLTVHEDKYYFMEMLSAGASGYVTKLAASDDLIQAIRTVAQGNIYLQPALARWLLEDYQRLAMQKNDSQPEADNQVVGLEVLSERERQVLEFVAKGLTNQEIGEQLELSPKTIARHRERIMKKLNLHSRTALVKFAIQTGLVKLS